MFAKKKNYTHKNCPVLGLKHREDDDESVTTKHRGVDVGSVYRNNTNNFVTLGWVTLKSNQPLTETIVLKFQFDHTCFQLGEVLY